MCYSGDAFLTLKTRVQANPLNTYLFSKPSFTSPQPLAASSGLTIPLQITLSEIKLSAFIILVFSRQKGLTLVFRNDPLESLKVSSTFDSIPFVRDYLQKEIEMQLRVLMMDELPAIIHRLSLRLWCPEYRAKEDEEMAQAENLETEEVAVDPFASPPQDAVDARGNVLDASEISSLSLDGGSEIHSLFSQKNLLHLAALTDSHRTLSLFTPSIQDAVFRAWAGPSERGDGAGSSTPATPSLVRSHSSHGSNSTIYTFTDNSADSGQMSSRPSQVSLGSATTGLSLGAGRHSRSHAGRKKKTRVVNLRRTKATDDMTSESGESETTESSAAPVSEPAVPTRIPEEPEEDIITPPQLSSGRVRFRSRQESIDLGETPQRLRPSTPARKSEQPSRVALSLDTYKVPEQAILDPLPSTEPPTPLTSTPISSHEHRPSYNRSTFAPHPAEKGPIPPLLSPSSSARGKAAPIHYAPHPALFPETPGGILEQAWVLKMAGEIARRVHDEKAAREEFWSSGTQGEMGREETPPPAYEVQ